MIVVGVIAAPVLLAVAIVFLMRRNAERLRSRFGPEYERVVGEVGGSRKAVAQLHQRERRVQGFAIKPLTPEQRERYVPAWTEIQTQFVDDPKAAMVDVDRLLSEVMGDRGYPIGEFEQRSADLSVDHPIVVQNYRTGHDIAVRDAPGQANTEDLRQAMFCYRALFRELVGEPPVGEFAATERVIDAVTEVATESAPDEPAPLDGSVVLETARPPRPVPKRPVWGGVRLMLRLIECPDAAKRARTDPRRSRSQKEIRRQLCWRATLGVVNRAQIGDAREMGRLNGWRAHKVLAADALNRKSVKRAR